MQYKNILMQYSKQVCKFHHIFIVQQIANKIHTLVLTLRMQYYIIYVGHLYEMCCFPPFKRTTLQFNSSKLSIATRFNASILIAITFIHYPLSFSYIKLQAVCIQLKIHQSLSNLIKIQVGILDKNEMFQFFFWPSFK